MGANSLAAIASDLEKMCKSKANLTDILSSIPRLSTAIDATSVALLEAVSKLSALTGDAQEDSHSMRPIHGASIGPAQLTQAARNGLRELEALLSASDLTALEKFSEIRHELSGLPDDQLVALESALQHLDLEDARRMCISILVGEAK